MGKQRRKGSRMSKVEANPLANQQAIKKAAGRGRCDPVSQKKVLRTPQQSGERGKSRESLSYGFAAKVEFCFPGGMCAMSLFGAVSALFLIICFLSLTCFSILIFRMRSFDGK